MTQPRLLITGATGTVGSHLIKLLQAEGISHRIASRNPDTSESTSKCGYSVYFDFTDTTTFDSSLDGIDKIFLVRPPALSDREIFRVFLESAKSHGVSHVVFLSLLGINPFTPHWKIEKLIKQLGFVYTFLRAGFFMQNLLQTHLHDIKHHNDIFIPAGGGKTSFTKIGL